MGSPRRADGTFVTPTLPFTALSPVDVFAVEDTTAQLTWRGLPAGPLTLTIDHADSSQTVQLGDAAIAGAADITGLRPGSSTLIDVAVAGRHITQRLATTLPGLADEPLAKIATISDLHLGENGFGLVRRLREPNGREPYALRCARAAVDEAQQWGADLLVIKGDITDQGLPHEWDLFDELLAGVSIPVAAVPGNHDTASKRSSLDATSELRRRGLCPEPVHTVELGVARVVLADSTVPGRGFGRLGRWAEELGAAADTDQPVFVFTHHHFEDRPYPWFWPLGVQHFDGRRLLDRLFEANPDVVISSGHTHRNRARRHATGLVTEVSSTKDFPGVWAGYSIHADGVRQVVRRVAEPSCVAWNDRTHAVVGGVWGRWSPGRLSDRCINHSWTRAMSSRQTTAGHLTVGR